MRDEIVAFRDDLPAKLELDAVLKVLDGLHLEHAACLDIGLSSPAMSLALRRYGASWSSLAASGPDAARLSVALDSPVKAYRPGDVIPFAEKSFDLVVLGQGQLTGETSELDYLRQCHRALKPSGHLVFSLERAKPWSLARLFKRFAAAPPDLPGQRRGYTERELFEVLKTGFDVFAIRTYSRFWVTLTRIWEESRLAAGEPGSAERRAVRRRAAVLYRIAYQMDGPLFWTRGYYMLVHGRRHVWRDRSAPVLRDGRKISDVVLSRSPR